MSDPGRALFTGTTGQFAQSFTTGRVLWLGTAIRRPAAVCTPPGTDPEARLSV